MPYDASKKKPIEQLTPFEVMVFELRAAGMSERDMYEGMKRVMDRKPPTYKEIRDALNSSGADPRPAGEGGVFNSHLLFKREVDPDSTEVHTFWSSARRVGKSERYPGFRVDRQRERDHEKSGQAPRGTVDRLIDHQIVGHMVRATYGLKDPRMMEDRAAQEYVDDLREGQFREGEGS